MSAAREPRSTFERALARNTGPAAEQQAARIAELLQQRPVRLPSRYPRARWGVSLAALTCVLGYLTFCGAGSRRRGNEPIGAAAVATDDGAGVGSSAAGFLPASTVRGPAPSSGAMTAAATQPTPPAAPAESSPGAAGRRSGPRVRPDRERPLPTPSPTPASSPVSSALANPPTPTPAPRRVLNMGTRLQVRLDTPLRTGSALVPATAALVADWVMGERVLLPAGTLLVGSAFATPHDDRVQILWRAVVHGGQTLGIEGETLGADGAPGLVGKVLDRRRKGVLRRLSAAVVSTAGDVASVAVPLGDGLLERAGSTLAGRTGQELSRLGSGREWLQADTVVELKAGVVAQVFLSADLVLPEPVTTPSPAPSQP